MQTSSTVIVAAVAVRSFMIFIRLAIVSVSTVVVLSLC